MTAATFTTDECCRFEPATELTADEFRATFRQHPAGVAVVGLRITGRLVGFTATSVISVSASPPLLAFSIDAASSSWPAVAAADSVAISFLGAHQHAVSTRFATSGIDRFAAGGWTALPTGEPVIDGAVSWVRGRVTQRIPLGGSHLVGVHVLQRGGRDGAVTPPLVYHDRTYHRLGPGSVLT